MLSKSWILLAAAALAALSSCSEDKEREKHALAGNETAVRALTDPVHGQTELRRLLQQKVAVSGDVVAVKGLTAGVQAIPLATPFVVRCDGASGVTLAFSPNLADDYSGLVVEISRALPSADDCMAITLTATKALNAILAGR